MKKFNYLVLILIGIYLLSRSIYLTKLPIFADEAIYLRWAQMIYHDPHQFLFLPMYDGKTPLFMWLLIPIIRLFTYDPLLGGRLLTTGFGLITALVLMKIIAEDTQNQVSKYIAFGVYILLPFSFFFDRLSLIDTPLTAFLALSFWMSLKWLKHQTWKLAVFTGIFWGLALLTKSSALYVIPVYIGILITSQLRQLSLQQRVASIFQFLIAGGIGLACLAALRISPLFPFLFHRSSDFAYSFNEISTQPLSIITHNLVRISVWLWIYCNPVIIIYLLGVLFLIIYQKQWHSLKKIGFFLICFLLYQLPFIVTGKLLTSRYFLPSIIWFIPAVTLAIVYTWKQFKLITSFMIVGMVWYSISFILPLYANLNATKLTNDDIHQYLSEWSAGYGIPEIRQYLTTRVNSGKSVLVATEGYFGTLPDGLFVYFSETPFLKHMEIVGIGQPIVSIPKEIYMKQKNYDETYIVVNQNRLNMDYHNYCQLIQSYPKPNNGSPLLLLKLL